MVNGSKVYNKTIVERLLETQNPRITLVPQPKAVSFLWKTFRRVCVDSLLQPYACCIVCKRIVNYQSRTGTSSLIRHKCPPKLRPILDMLREDTTPWAMTVTPIDVAQQPDILERAIKRQRRDMKIETLFPASPSPTNCIQVTPSRLDGLGEHEDCRLQACDEGEDYGLLAVEKARHFFLKELWPMSLLESSAFIELTQSLIDLGARAGSVHISSILSRSAIFADLHNVDLCQVIRESSVFSVEFWKNYQKKKFFTVRCHYLDETFHRISNEIKTSEYNSDNLKEPLQSFFESVGKIIKIPDDFTPKDSFFITSNEIFKTNEGIIIPSFSDFLNTAFNELCNVEGISTRCQKWTDLRSALHEIQDVELMSQIHSTIELASQMFENLSTSNAQIGACYLWWLKLERKIEAWNNPVFEKLKSKKYQFHVFFYIALCLDPSFKSLKMIDDKTRENTYRELQHILRGVPKLPKEEPDEKPEADVSSSNFFAEFMEPNPEQIDDLERYQRHMSTCRSDAYEFWQKTSEFPTLRSVAKILLAIPTMFSPKDRILDGDSMRLVQKRMLFEVEDLEVLRLRDIYCQM
ncbi:uncharacterized protein LOC136026236 isoform X2 [Artemia franciscana]